MSGEQLQIYLAAAMSSLTVGVIVPLLILFGIAVCLWVLVARAQKDATFSIQNALRDENGKESASRLIMFGCFAVSSWSLSVIVFALPAHVIDALFYYLLFWSGTDVAKAIVGKWNGNLPFGNGKQSAASWTTTTETSSSEQSTR